jgi:acyl carrier protein
MLTREDIRAVIKDTVIGFNIEDLKDEQDFSEAGIDSLDHLTILLSMEEKYAVEKIPDEDIDKCRSVAGIVEYLGL